MIDCIAAQKQSIIETDVGNELQQINNDDATQHTDANKATSMMDTLRSNIVSGLSVQRHYIHLKLCNCYLFHSADDFDCQPSSVL